MPIKQSPDKKTVLNKAKRETLLLLTTGALSIFSPFRIVAADATSTTELDMRNKTKLIAFDGSGNELPVKVVLSTLGKGSAIITITSQANVPTTVVNILPGLIEHNGIEYDLTASLGRAGIRIQPNKRRIVIAKQVQPQPAALAALDRRSAVDPA